MGKTDFPESFFLSYANTPHNMYDIIGDIRITYPHLTTAKGAFYCIRSCDGGHILYSMFNSMSKRSR